MVKIGTTVFTFSPACIQINITRRAWIEEKREIKERREKRERREMRETRGLENKRMRKEEKKVIYW
jgi:FtsZ-interacting cell division protein YlmF